MKVGILGTGEVGRALGTGFAQLGHEVKMGSRGLRTNSWDHAFKLLRK